MLAKYTVNDLAVQTCYGIIYILVKLEVNSIYKFVHTLQLLYKIVAIYMYIFKST